MLQASRQLAGRGVSSYALLAFVQDVQKWAQKCCVKCSMIFHRAHHNDCDGCKPHYFQLPQVENIRERILLGQVGWVYVPSCNGICQEQHESWKGACSRCIIQQKNVCIPMAQSVHGV